MTISISAHCEHSCGPVNVCEQLLNHSKLLSPLELVKLASYIEGAKHLEYTARTSFWPGHLG